MSFVPRLQHLGRRLLGIDDPRAWTSLSGFVSSAGVTITPELAMRCDAVYASIQVLAQDTSTVPLCLFRKGPNGREKVTNHPLYSILHDRPNEEMTSVDLRRSWIEHYGLRGNSCSFIDMNEGSRVLRLVPMHPDHVVPKKRDHGRGPLYYEYTEPGFAKPYEYEPENILHIRNISTNGLWGRRPIQQMADAIGVGIAEEQYAGAIFREGGSQRIALESDKPLGKDGSGAKNLRESFQKSHAGLDKLHVPLVLEDGVTAKAIGINPQDAQMLESRKFTAGQIAARGFRVAPHLIGEMSDATFDNIRSQTESHVKFTLRPLFTIIEQELNAKLLTDEERRKGLYIEHVLEGLLRGSPDERAAYYSAMLQWGVMTRDEVCEKENLQRKPGGDRPMIPANFIIIGTDGKPIYPPKVGAALQNKGNGTAQADSAVIVESYEEQLPPSIKARM